VLLFHLGAAGVPGGFVGVDVFFVISGYLMTRIIVGESAAGSFSLANFYARRFRRILPALLATVMVTLALGYEMLMPGEYAAAGKSAVASAASLSNVFFYFNTGYFDGAAELMPLLHTWSLGVEEQFYLIWPVLLMAAWRLSGRSHRMLMIVIAGCALLSFGCSVAWLAVDAKAAFYMLPSRLWELAAGGLIVFLPASRFSDFAALPGLALIIGAALWLTKMSPFPGANALAPVVGAAMVIAGSRASLPARTLAWPPMVLLGRISYSLYLWHWPIIVFWKEYNNAVPDMIESAGLAALSIAVAWLSWRFIEQPFRHKSRRSGRTLSYGLAVASLAALAGYAVAADQGLPERMPAALAHLGDPAAMWSYACPDFAPSINIGCAVGVPWGSARARGLLWGDSHAAHLVPFLDAAGKASGRAIAYLPGCTPPLGRRIKSTYDTLLQEPARCTADRARGMNLIRQFPEIEFVIIASRIPAFLDKLEIDGDARPASVAHGLDMVRAELQSTIDEIRSMGRQVLLISGVPEFDRDPEPCATIEDTPLWRDGRGHACAASTQATLSPNNANQEAISAVYDELARSNDGVFSLSLSKHMCPNGDCVKDLDGEFLYRDSVHLRRDLPPEINAKLSATGQRSRRR
jgi:peptidoglycan/LPS O-acetylase OafA/YrhL